MIQMQEGQKVSDYFSTPRWLILWINWRIVVKKSQI